MLSDINFLLSYSFTKAIEFLYKTDLFHIKFVYLLFILLFLNYCDKTFCEEPIWIQCDAFLEFFHKMFLSYSDSDISIRNNYMDWALARCAYE